MGDYSLTMTEFGNSTVIIGTSQVVAIIFIYQFGTRFGVGWSLVAGILVLLLGSGGLLWGQLPVLHPDDISHPLHRRRVHAHQRPRDLVQDGGGQRDVLRDVAVPHRGSCAGALPVSTRGRGQFQAVLADGGVPAGRRLPARLLRV